MKKEKFVIIEQGEEGNAYITRVKSESYDRVFKDISEGIINLMDNNNIVVLSEDSFNDLILSGRA